MILHFNPEKINYVEISMYYLLGANKSVIIFVGYKITH